jgi:hypothetical protein
MSDYKFIRVVQRRSKIVMVSKDNKKWVSLNEAIGVDGDFDITIKVDCFDECIRFANGK